MYCEHGHSQLSMCAFTALILCYCIRVIDYQSTGSASEAYISQSGNSKATVTQAKIFNAASVKKTATGGAAMTT